MNYFDRVILGMRPRVKIDVVYIESEDWLGTTDGEHYSIHLSPADLPDDDEEDAGHGRNS